MENKFDEERWLLADSSDNAVNIKQDEDGGEENDDDDEEEETLSLIDLPQIQHSKTEHEEEEKQSIGDRAIEIQEDFNFCRSFSLKTEMCTADEVFFQGKILPLRHSVSSEKGLLKYCGSRSISRSESDRYYSGGLFSSRSSSISSSHQSSSSGSSTATRRRRHPKPPRNQFHSHPSPSPRILKQGILNPTKTNSPKKSSLWSIFQLGLVTPPPEIVFQDFKPRFPSNNRSNSKNSTISTSSKNSNPGEKKKKKKKRALFGAGCKCSADAVDTVPSEIVLMKRNEEEESRSPKLTKQQEVKKEMSHHRTFEWLKQLSLDDAGEEA